jgi:hypothetical protein
MTSRDRALAFHLYTAQYDPGEDLAKNGGRQAFGVILLPVGSGCLLVALYRAG